MTYLVHIVSWIITLRISFSRRHQLHYTISSLVHGHLRNVTFESVHFDLGFLSNFSGNTKWYPCWWPRGKAFVTDVILDSCNCFVELRNYDNYDYDYDNYGIIVSHDSLKLSLLSFPLSDGLYYGAVVLVIQSIQF